MQHSPLAWIEALRHSHDRLEATVAPLDADAVQGPSYASQWSIGQVLSHLGSGAEIFGNILDAVLDGEELPARESMPAIWQAWDARGPAELVVDALRTDDALVARLESLAAEQRTLQLSLFGMDLDLAGFARLRLGEHAVHTWDIAVALDPAATVAQDAVELLVDMLGMLAARAGKPGDKPLTVQVSTTSPERHMVLQADDKVSIAEADGSASAAGGPQLRLPAEALVRLVYGRLDQAHTPPVEAVDVDLDELRQLFPGF